MADFQKAFAITMAYEGEYSNDPDDRGGETYRGIARKINHTWEAWGLIDRYRKRPDFPECLKGDAYLQRQVMLFYKRRYWDGFAGDAIPDLVAVEMFDCAVNCGLGTAIKFLQRAVNQIMHMALEEDGGFGPRTFQAFQGALTAGSEKALIENLKGQRRGRYLHIVESDPTQQKYLKGWLRRVDEAVA